jgi:hypothetical protein
MPGGVLAGALLSLRTFRPVPAPLLFFVFHMPVCFLLFRFGDFSEKSSCLQSAFRSVSASRSAGGTVDGHKDVYPSAVMTFSLTGAIKRRKRVQER